MDISDVRFSAAPHDLQTTGLLGWVSVTVAPGVRLDSIAVRRTLGGRLALSYPTRRDSLGREHFYFRPLNERARRYLEHQVFQALRIDGGSSVTQQLSAASKEKE